LQALLSNAQEVYKVPLYQRPYAWTRDQWENLFEDINRLETTDVHFLGSIVVVPEGEHRLGVNYFQVVDGQQRLATVLIWLSAIRDIAEEKGNDSVSSHLTETFLFAKELESDKRREVPKFQLGELDNDAFQRVLEGKPRKYNCSIFECYEYFKNKSNNGDIWKDLWKVLLNNISIVHINAFNHFNAFRLFETLNDRGLELSAADLIKNFLLMKVSFNEDIFKETISQWNEMYEKIRNKEPVKFIRRYVLSTYKGKVSESRLYEEVRKKLEKEKPKNIQDFVKNLNFNATIYKKIIDCNFSKDRINKKLQELHLVEVSPSFTLLLKVIPYLLENEKISEDDIFNIMEMIEIFHIRWGICGQSTSRLDQIYNELCMELSNKQPGEFKETIKKKLLQEIKNNIDDEIFKRNFENRLFRPNETRTKYILWKLSKPTGETVINIKDIQTEHILPRTLNSKDGEWVKYLEQKTSKTKEEIMALHKENLNRIGNLTIIKSSWNISMSNRLFDEKKKDYEKSEFQITKKLLNYDKWTFEEISRRSKNLAEEAVRVWKI